MTSPSDRKRVIDAAAITGLTACLLIGLWSFLPWLPPVPTVAVIAVFAGLFPTLAAAIFTRGIKRVRTPKVFETGRSAWPFPSWFGVVVIFGFIAFFSGMAQLPGQPEAHGGVYYFNDHGSQIPTDHAGYQRGLRAQNRIFSGIPAVFYAVALAAWRRGSDAK